MWWSPPRVPPIPMGSHFPFKQWPYLGLIFLKNLAITEGPVFSSSFKQSQVVEWWKPRGKTTASQAQAIYHRVDAGKPWTWTSGSAFCWSLRLHGWNKMEKNAIDKKQREFSHYVLWLSIPYIMNDYIVHISMRYAADRYPVNSWSWLIILSHHLSGDGFLVVPPDHAGEHKPSHTLLGPSSYRAWWHMDCSLAPVIPIAFSLQVCDGHTKDWNLM